MTNLVEVARYLDPEEAICAQSYLRAHGIYSVLQGWDHLAMQPWHRIALNGYGLLCSETRAANAHELLKEVLVEFNSRDAEFDDFEPLSRSRRLLRLCWVPVAFFSGVPFLPIARSRSAAVWHIILLVTLCLPMAARQIWFWAEYLYFSTR